MKLIGCSVCFKATVPKNTSIVAGKRVCKECKGKEIGFNYGGKLEWINKKSI